MGKNKKGKASVIVGSTSELRRRLERRETDTSTDGKQKHARVDSAMEASVIKNLIQEGQEEPWDFMEHALGGTKLLYYGVVEPVAMGAEATAAAIVWSYLRAPSWRAIRNGFADPIHRTQPNGFSNILPGNRLKNLIITAIAFVLVFGSLWSLCEYLPDTRAYAECTPSTVYIPTTTTVTSTELITLSGNEVSPAGINTQSLPSIAASATSGAALSSIVTVPSFSGTYVFSVSGSSTMWKDGISPSSGAQLTIATSTVVISPANPTATDITTYGTSTRTSTVNLYTTITLPTTTLTEYAVMSTALTTTSTSTHYVTYTMSEVSPKTSFGGMSSGGWNASETTPGQQPAVMTITQTHYYGSDNVTTSTGVSRITTTIGATITTTLTPPATVITLPGSGGLLSSTTLSAAPVTVTYTVPPVFSTSVSFTGTANVTSASAAALTQSSGYSAIPTLGSSASVSLASLSATSVNVSPVSIAPVSLSAPLTTLTLANSTSPTMSQLGVSTGTGFGSTQSRAGASPMTSLATINVPTGPSTTFTLSALPSSITPSPGATYTSNGSVAMSAAGLSSIGAPLAYTPTLSATTSIEASGNATSISSLQLPSSRPSLGAQTQRSVTPATLPLPALPTSATSSASIGAASGLPSAVNQSLTYSVLPTSSLRDQPTLTAPLFPTLPPSINSSATITSSSFSNPFPATSVTAIPSQGCGEQGNFTLDFDDLPTFHASRLARPFARRQVTPVNGTGSGADDITQQPPLDLRPYHHLSFSSGFVYAPASVEPYSPVSSPNVAVFLTGVRTSSNPFQNTESGDIGEGPYPDSDSSFWFNLYSMFLGCDSPGPEPCIMEVTGFQWNATIANETTQFVQNFTLPPCPGLKNCQLTQVNLTEAARNLSGLEVSAVSAGTPRMWFLDDAKMGWSNASCEAGLKRQRSQ